MKPDRLLLSVCFLIFLSFSSIAQDTADPRIGITARDGKLSASGIVDSEYTKAAVIDSLHKLLSIDVSTQGLRFETGIRPLDYTWKQDLETDLHDPSRWHEGVLVFPLEREEREKRILATLHGARLRLLGQSENTLLINPSAKATIIYLFATWCGPCRYQIPELNQIYDQSAGKGLEIIAIDADEESEENIRAFIKQYNVAFKTGAGEAGLIKYILRLSRFDGIPQALILADGKLVGIFRGASPATNREMMESVVRLLEK